MDQTLEIQPASRPDLGNDRGSSVVLRLEVDRSRVPPTRKQRRIDAAISSSDPLPDLDSAQQQLTGARVLVRLPGLPRLAVRHLRRLLRVEQLADAGAEVLGQERLLQEARERAVAKGLGGAFLAVAADQQHAHVFAHCAQPIEGLLA